MSEVLSAFVAATGEEDAVATGGGGFGIGSVVLVLAIVGLLVWMAYLFLNSRRSTRAASAPTPLNQSPYLSDDELENVRTTKVLRAAVFAAAAMAIILPWYAFNEPDRQAEASDELTHLDIEEGEKLFHTFECFTCHGEDLGGGTAAFVEARSGVPTNWLVPSLNDVLYRYDESEVRYVIEFGRSGTPMPANGLVGGGSMTLQEIDQIIAYIASKQIPQAEVVAKTERNVTLALVRIESGADATRIRIEQQQARIDDVLGANDVLAAAGSLADDMLDLLGGAGTCTAASAELALTTCDDPGPDTDRDGLTDEAERQLTGIASIAYENLTKLLITGTGSTISQQAVYDVEYDPANAFTTTGENGLPVADLDTAAVMLSALQSDLLLVEIKANKQADFLAPLESGMDYLIESARLMPWAVDFTAVSADMGVSTDDAQRAVGLFNSYCARCHSGGYSAGSTFEVGPGRGAWGPAINDGRTLVQFPSLEDHVSFIIDGTGNAVFYGVNGLGTGRMPGHGTSLSEADIRLIALYERTL